MVARTRRALITLATALSTVGAVHAQSPQPPPSRTAPFTCAEIEQRVTKTHGKPDDIRRFSEEATPRADRIWRSAREMMTVICFQQHGQWLAEAVMITPAR